MRVRWAPGLRSRDVASTRLRCILPSRLLAGAGVDSRLLRRHERPRADVVVFQKAYGPDHLALAGRLRRSSVRLVLDVCDNHFHNPAGSRELAARVDRLKRMVDLVDVVTVSTPTLAGLVQHDRRLLVDDCVEWPVEGEASRKPRASDDPFRLLWFGSAGDPTLGFGLCDLGQRMPELAAFAAGRAVELVVASNSEEQFRRWIGDQPFPVHYEAWRRRRFPALLKRSDVAVLPVTPNPFTTAKTSNRPVTALLHGVAVVTSPLPSYLELSPFLLFEAWADHLTRYAEDPALAATHVAHAGAYVAERFSDASVVGQWQDAIGH